jgi:hypothetical protein
MGPEKIIESLMGLLHSKGVINDQEYFQIKSYMVIGMKFEDIAKVIDSIADENRKGNTNG